MIGMTGMTRTGGRLPWRQRALALVMALALLVALVPPAVAEERGAAVEPALARAIAANPGGEFAVIVTISDDSSGPGRGGDAKKVLESRSGRQDQLEKDIRGRGGKKLARLGIIGGQAATLSAKEIGKLAKSKLVESISLDHPIVLNAVDAQLIGTLTGTTSLLSTQTIAAGAPQVWSEFGNTGAGITVAVLDSGIAASADYSAVYGTSTVSADTVLVDMGGHGTHVAGIAAGTGALSGGAYKGLAPGARVLMVKVIGDHGSTSYSSVIKALQWLIQNRGVHNIRVANLSFGSPAVEGYLNDPLVAAVEMAWFAGITVVVSAGNSGPGVSTVTVPGIDPYVITVGALDDNLTGADPADDLVPDWTSRGPTPFDNLAKPDLVASGRRVVSVRSIGSYLDATMPDRVTGPDNLYFRLSGTSMAAPVVAGVAALVLAQNPGLTPNQVKYVLTSTARPIAGQPTTSVGAGAVDALAAVRLAASGQAIAKANVGLVPNYRFARTIYPLAKGSPLKWRNLRHKNISWENVTWENISWDNVTWENLTWENITWESANWSNITWENLTWENITWESIGWDNTTWDTAGSRD